MIIMMMIMIQIIMMVMIFIDVGDEDEDGDHQDFFDFISCISVRCSNVFLLPAGSILDDARGNGDW